MLEYRTNVTINKKPKMEMKKSYFKNFSKNFLDLFLRE